MKNFTVHIDKICKCCYYCKNTFESVRQVLLHLRIFHEKNFNFSIESSTVVLHTEQTYVRHWGKILGLNPDDIVPLQSEVLLSKSSMVHSQNNSRKLKLEICVDNFQSALIAQEAGADRVELCQALEVGGLTPSHGLMVMCKEHLNIPVYVLIRPRAGDFTYSEAELKQMEITIRDAISIGVDGFVFGVLKGQIIDRTACQRLLSICSGKPVTFHRAFDFTKNIFNALEDVIELKFDRVLTTGQADSAFEGRKNIADLIVKARDRIVIMPGGGISNENLPILVQETKACEYHASSRKDNPILPTYSTPFVVCGALTHHVVCHEKASQLVSVLKQLCSV